MKSSLGVILLAFLLAACGGTTISPTAVVTATRTAEVARTLVATEAPSATLQPSPTTAPSATPQPSPTLAPSNTAPPPTTTRPAAPPTQPNTPEAQPSPAVIAPTFVNHEPPALALDWTIFENAGCTVDSNNRRFCDAKSELGALGCDEIAKPADLLAALEPKYPIAMCFVEPYLHPDHQEPPQGSYLYRRGGLLGMYARLVIRRDDKFEIIHTVEELTKVYAPIASPEEALAYAVAATGLVAEYGIKQEPEYVYLTDVIEDTFAKPEGDGYLVHLFSYQFFGCGPHPTSSLDFHVKSDGALEVKARQELFKDPRLDGLCVD